MVVDVAAVIGREFGFPLLRTAAAFDDEDAATAVEELVRRRIFRFADERFDFGQEFFVRETRNLNDRRHIPFHHRHF